MQYANEGVFFMCIWSHFDSSGIVRIACTRGKLMNSRVIVFRTSKETIRPDLDKSKGVWRAVLVAIGGSSLWLNYSLRLGLGIDFAF